MASYGVWKGINAGITNATNTALNIAQLQGQQAHQRAIEANDMQRLKMQEEQFNMSKKKYEYEDAERQKKEQLDNAFTPASLIAPQIHQLPETKKTYLDAVRQAGFEVKEGEDGEVYLPNKAYSYLNQLQQTNMEFSKGVTDKMLVDLQSKSVAIGQQILQVQENGGDLKKLGPLVQQQNAVKQQIAGIYSVQPKIMEELEKERMKQDAALEKERFLEEGRNRRADAQNATTIKAANVRSSRESKPTEGDIRYQSYVAQMKADGKRPMSRYQFDVWYDQQTTNNGNNRGPRSLSPSGNTSTNTKIPTF